MIYSKSLIPTLKEDPREAEVISHRLLLRAGYIRKVAAGIYDYLPLALRVIRKIEGIVRSEMDASGCQEILMPMVQPSQLWQDSGRWDKFGPEFLRFKDRKGGEFGLGPTHEEVVTDIARREIRSYRQLPINLYQIQTKFRDEVRPRAGLMRGREFLMKDGYSFDATEESARQSYDQMFAAYTRIFGRCGLDFRPVEAATGAMGGKLSHEFQVLADSGEDLIVACNKCNYAANVEQAELVIPGDNGAAGTPKGCERTKEMESVDTPDQRTIDEVSAYLKKSPETFIKSLVYLVDTEPVVVLVRGDHEVNEIKLAQVLNAANVVLAGDQAVMEATGAPVGFAGPVGAKVRVVADYGVMGVVDGVTGANIKDKHLINVNVGRDYQPSLVADLRQAKAGDQCARCGGQYQEFRGIEVGQVFFLGTRYSDSMQATFLDPNGQDNPLVMGCYGIGITRVMAAAIEQNHDKDGIVWPMPIAPYQVIITIPAVKNELAVAKATELYHQLQDEGVEVLLDDRDERAGVKFKDADLIGIPIRVAVGPRGLAQGNLEVKLRRESSAKDVPVDQAITMLKELIRTELERCTPGVAP